LKSGNAIAGLTVASDGDFARSGGTCGSAVSTGTSCSIVVTFTARAAGARTGTLSLAHGGTLTPIAIRLSGTGAAAAAPAATLTASLAFGNVDVGSAAPAQLATLANTGTAPLVIAGMSTGSTEFTRGTGTCAVGASVAPGSSCAIGVLFTPA